MIRIRSDGYRKSTRHVPNQRIEQICQRIFYSENRAAAPNRLQSALEVHTKEASLTNLLSSFTLTLLVQCIIFLLLIDCTTLLLFMVIFKFSVLLALITGRRTSTVFSFILIKNNET